MKTLIALTTSIFIFTLVHAQTDSLFLKRYEQLIHENGMLKIELEQEKNRYTELNGTYAKDTLKLMTQLNAIKKELQSEKEKVSNFSKNKLIIERDYLLAKVDSMNNIIISQIITITEKDRHIATEKSTAIGKAESAKNEGKREVVASIIDLYKNRSFDELVRLSTSESVNRDIVIVGDNPTIKPILNDLLIYFSAKNMLSEKFDPIQVKNAQMQLKHIQRQSQLLEKLKEEIDYYKDFNVAFKEAIILLLNLDKQKSTGGDSDVQKLKFNEIGDIIINYMYNYYDFSNYPYLSEILLDIIKIKKLNADEDISHFLKKLE